MVYIVILGLFPWSGLQNPTPPQLVRCGLPAHILDEADVKRQLSSGLTTSFRIVARTQSRDGNERQGMALIEVRYELWDEVFLVKTIESNGLLERVSFKNLQAFKSWWVSRKLVVLESRFVLAPGPVSLTLEVLPFSRTEQNHAREWLSESGNSPVPISKESSLPRAEQAETRSSNRIFNVIVATSLKRKPLLRYRWKVPPSDAG